MFVNNMNTQSHAGIVGSSPYDKLWDIYVATCNEDTVVYRNCIVTNMGEWVIAFIPDQTRIQSPNGREIIVNKNLCTSVMLIEIK